MTESSLKGKVAFVTGGARGLGEAICTMLSEEGASVVLADIREDMAVKVAGRLRGSNGNKVEPLVLDVRDDAQVDQIMQSVLNQYGRLDILINNAGTDKTVPIDELEIEDWDRVLDTNLRGPFLLSKFALPVMKQQGAGHIVNIASTAAKRAWPNAAAYHASKWGLLGFSHALHTEARQYGVKVSAIVVGGMRTPFLLDRFEGIDLDTLQDPKNVAATIRFVLTQPPETVIPEVMVLPMRETSWP
jgi:NAD(P)-dependent dehydrogenase (short-subunit alcohol dehydrogenase family)